MSFPILYIKKGCPHCKVAMDYLDQRHIEYQSIDVRGDAARMQALKISPANPKRRRWIGTEPSWRISGSPSWSRFFANARSLDSGLTITRQVSSKQTP